MSWSLMYGILFLRTVSTIWRWFNNLRTLFTRIKTKKSGVVAATITEREAWIL